MKDLLGGKGANLADMTLVPLPVPPGFTITTDTCGDYNDAGQKLPKGLMEEVRATSPRSRRPPARSSATRRTRCSSPHARGAKFSMPGMMDTVLNIGLNDAAVEGLAELSNNPRFAYDSYRRLINMFGDTVMGVDHHHFEHELSAVKNDRGVELDTDLDVEALKEVVDRYKKVYQEHVGSPFPADPFEQLEAAIEAVFKSWMGDRAIRYRELNDIRGVRGTAVNVQAMVFGNMGDDSATGVAFTRDPVHRRERLLRRVPRQRAGRRRRRRHPHPARVQDRDGQVEPEELEGTARRQERPREALQGRAGLRVHDREGQAVHAPDPQRQAHRAGGRRIAVEMVKEKLIDEKTGDPRVEPASLDQLLHPTFNPHATKDVHRQGSAGLAGAAVGKLAFTAEEPSSASAGREDHPRPPRDRAGRHRRHARLRCILTSTGGMTEPRGRSSPECMGTPCGRRRRRLHIDAAKKQLSVNVQDLRRRIGCR
jgi:pyruvate,orthophosphate dikinase